MGARNLEENTEYTRSNIDTYNNSPYKHEAQTVLFKNPVRTAQ
jgi:hypothetical protein